ncbi:uncharacterized protein SPPG_01201 [Spizellomyces punctatus DAOM BR117]|uniref:snRNA-activating protein complex subunit 3 n=1 Tax=Spizellomyces punctatus (strain DAOM BR117) TaxID=645134 RepID=A0A0L0HRM2_SPIPD|nr:uncharacterized protein SPPG_01201 [Spizellomyces punctatus DAOM BR117]KND03743.1 hypothetical protein SPPG_01201 [Spizellomyces punctatus DAOM BR117]|eukprot:XP_016611782.1 hypothetical protein SPPG_01201 [Spizellomyces punctatus DAOM BR117]
MDGPSLEWKKKAYGTPSKAIKITQFRDDALKSRATQLEAHGDNRAGVQERPSPVFEFPLSPLDSHGQEDVDTDESEDFAQTPSAFQEFDEYASQNGLGFLEQLMADDPVDPEEESTKIALDEIVISVVFCHPRRGRHQALAEIQVLGSQPLTALRNTFYCPTDFLQLDNWDPPIDNLQVKQSASYFFIENVFYIDTRNPSAADYSRPIIEWAEEEGRHPSIGPYLTDVMSERRFIDLTLRLNTPYLFVHQGNCEHIMVFKEVRLITEQDDRRLHAYPKTIASSRLLQFHQLCNICGSHKAEWATTEDMRADRDPCLWCDDCFDKFHFNEDGSKAFDFEAHRFCVTIEPPKR